MCFVNLVDSVSQLTSPPVFKAMNLTTICGDYSLITLEHGRNLLALIRK